MEPTVESRKIIALFDKGTSLLVEGMAPVNEKLKRKENHAREGLGNISV